MRRNESSTRELQLVTHKPTRVKAFSNLKRVIQSRFPLQGDRASQLEFISYSFHCGDAINSQLLTDLADMDINGAVADNHIVAPNLA